MYNNSSLKFTLYSIEDNIICNVLIIHRLVNKLGYYIVYVIIFADNSSWFNYAYTAH